LFLPVSLQKQMGLISNSQNGFEKTKQCGRGLTVLQNVVLRNRPPLKIISTGGNFCK